MKVSKALLAALVAALLAGCGQHAVPVSAPVPTSVPPVATPSYVPISAAAACPTADGVHLPDHVDRVDGAYFCVRETRPVPGDGEWQFSVVRGVTSGIDGLLRAYRTPDAPPTAGGCTADLRNPRVVYLHLSRMLAVRAPVDGCGHPAAAAVQAFESLGTVEINATKLNRITSQLAQTSGCSDAYKDMLAIEESSGGPRQVSSAPRPVESGASLCIYTVTLDAHGYRFTWLSSARQLTRTDVNRINSALAGSTEDASCSRHQHERFALLQPAGSPGGPTTLVALDGCAVQQDGGWWRATDRLRALIAG